MDTTTATSGNAGATRSSWVALLACNLMWALQFTCIKLVQDQVGAFATVFIPMLLATLFMLPFVLNDLRNNKNRKLADLKVFAALALAGQFPAQVLMTFGTQHSTASNAALLNLSMPVVAALLAVLMLGEKMTPLRWLSFGIASVGVALCSLKDLVGVNFGIQYGVGNLLILSGVLGSAFYNTWCKKIAAHYTEMEMLFYTYIFMLLLLLPFVWHYEGGVFKNMHSFTRNTWIGLILLTVFHNFLSMILFFSALKRIEAIQAAFSNFLIAFFALPIAIFILGESLGFWAIVGGFLVLTGTVLITVYEYRQQIGSDKASEG
jgi:drug/metabolite transporter (DMT)-like permease